MDGYSVQEAASVLGVAEGRVWELLARGVLLGTPEGDSMRVFLKGQPGEVATAGTREEPRTNGNGGSHASAGEASAFRELLTEFRNLTERYGQALLALGEARGEVAGLRTRVDQLEARFDLRLPPPLEPAPVAWESTTISAAPPDQAAAPPRTAVPAAAVRRTSRPRRARTAREATAGFADALARAQDPSAAELGPTHGEPEPAAALLPADEAAWEAAEPVAVPPGVMEADAEELVAVAPEAEASAEAEPVMPAEEAEPVVAADAPTYSAVVVEPDWFADGDFAWLDAAEHELPEGPASEAVAAETEVEPSDQVAEAPPLQPAEQPPEPHPEPQPEQQLLEEQALPLPPLPEPIPPSVVEPAPAESEAPEPEAPARPWQALGSEADATDTPEPPESGGAEGQEMRLTSSAVAAQELEEEVMWLGAEPGLSVRDEPSQAVVAEAEPWPSVDMAAIVTDPVRPPLAMTEDELARLALDEGWDEAEVAAIRAMITPLPSATVNLPGAAELHDAMAALEAVPVRTEPVPDPARQWAKPIAPEDPPARQDDWAFEAEPAPPMPEAPHSPMDVTAALRRSVTDPGWLRRRQGPAAAAYRRLRRLLPG
jgi:hypothetical protein